MEASLVAEDPVTFSVVVPRRLAERLTKIAQGRGTKRSQLARQLLAEGADRHERLDRIAHSLDDQPAIAAGA
jgi:hypothetical protein